MTQSAFTRRIRALLSPMRGQQNQIHLEGMDHWDEVGVNQFEYLKKEGLKPHHYLLDIPCGSFRAGRFLIDYLVEGHYYGADASTDHVEAGVRHVLVANNLLVKRPTTRVVKLTTEQTDFAKLFCRQFDYIWVHALFDHIPHGVIRQAICDLSDILVSGGRMYATIFLNPHGASFQEPMIRPRNGSLERAVVTFPDREYWHHTIEFFEEVTTTVPALSLDACLFDYPHPLGLRMLRFVRK